MNNIPLITRNGTKRNISSSNLEVEPISDLCVQEKTAVLSGLCGPISVLRSVMYEQSRHAGVYCTVQMHHHKSMSCHCVRTVA